MWTQRWRPSHVLKVGLISEGPLQLKLPKFHGPCAPAHWPLCHPCAKTRRQSARSLFNVKDWD